MENTETVRRSQRLMKEREKRLSVEHDPINHVFYIAGEGGRKNFLEYRCMNNCMELLHTEVAPEHQGRGLGKMLAKEALEYVAQHDYELVIKCDFIQHFVTKYEPKYLKYMQSK